MPRKAKPTKHTKKELNAKIFAANVNRGGGKKGIADRTDAKLKFTCQICKVKSPSEKSFRIHFDAKHPKATLNLEEHQDKAE